MQIQTTPSLDKQIRKWPNVQRDIDNLTKKVLSMTEFQLRANHGTHLERLPDGTNSIRAGKGPRVICMVEADTLIMLAIQHHDDAYKRGDLHRFASFEELAADLVL